MLRVSMVFGQCIESVSDSRKSSSILRTRLMPKALSAPFGNCKAEQSVGCVMQIGHRVLRRGHRSCFLVSEQVQLKKRSIST